VDVEAVADELYGLPPGEFTATREARAAEARREGDREAAGAIRRLRRPTTGAWLANLLVRRDHDAVRELLELGAAMRQAHADLAGQELRRLAEQRHRLIAGLKADAGRLADDELGQPVNDANLAEVEATLEAASADPDAAIALRGGRLTVALRYSGLGPVELRSPADPRRPEVASSRSPASRGRSARPRPRDADRPGRGAARRTRRETVAAAERELRTNESATREADDELARHEEDIARLEADLEQLRAGEAAVLARLEEAKRGRESARRRQRSAATALERARSALEGLRG
jgi:hypothetical protein